MAELHGGSGGGTIPKTTATKNKAVGVFTGMTLPQIAVLGIGIAGMLFLSTTRFAPLVVAFIIAAIVYQAVHGGAVKTFLGWLNL